MMLSTDAVSSAERHNMSEIMAQVNVL